MNDLEKERILRWIESLKNAQPVNEAERRENIQRVEIATFILQTNGMVHTDLKKNGFPQNSGLVEQQKWFMKLHKKNLNK